MPGTYAVEGVMAWASEILDFLKVVAFLIKIVKRYHWAPRKFLVGVPGLCPFQFPFLFSFGCATPQTLLSFALSQQ